jgi:hypothetical protein
MRGGFIFRISKFFFGIQNTTLLALRSMRSMRGGFIFRNLRAYAQIIDLRSRVSCFL